MGGLGLGLMLLVVDVGVVVFVCLAGGRANERFVSFGFGLLFCLVEEWFCLGMGMGMVIQK